METEFGNAEFTAQVLSGKSSARVLHTPVDFMEILTSDLIPV